MKSKALGPFTLLYITNYRILYSFILVLVKIHFSPLHCSVRVNDYSNLVLSAEVLVGSILYSSFYYLKQYRALAISHNNIPFSFSPKTVPISFSPDTDMVFRSFIDKEQAKVLQFHILLVLIKHDKQVCLNGFVPIRS